MYTVNLNGDLGENKQIGNDDRSFADLSANVAWRLSCFRSGSCKYAGNSKEARNPCRAHRVSHNLMELQKKKRNLVFLLRRGKSLYALSTGVHWMHSTEITN